MDKNAERYTSNSQITISHEKTFLQELTSDIEYLLQLLAEDPDSQTLRRSAIRSIFANIEGIVWELKSDIIPSIADGPRGNTLSPSEALAIRDLSYSVDDTGTIKKRVNYIPLKNSVRLVARIMEKIDSTFTVEFSDSNWSDLLSSIDTRHRLTHPKTIDDLLVKDIEIDMAKRSYLWFMKLYGRFLVTATAINIENSKIYELGTLKTRNAIAILREHAGGR